MRLQQARGANYQILVLGDGGQVIDPADEAVAAALEIEKIAQIQELEDRLQGVIAVGAPAGDVQKQIDLGGRRPVQTAF